MAKQVIFMKTFLRKLCHWMNTLITRRVEFLLGN